MKWKRSKKAQQEAKQKEDCQKAKSIASSSPNSGESCLAANKDSKNVRIKNPENLEIRVGFPVNMSKAIYPSHGNGFSDKSDASNASYVQPSTGLKFPSLHGKKNSLPFSEKSSGSFADGKNGGKVDEENIQSSEESLQSGETKSNFEESDVALAQINVKGLGQIAHNKRYYMSINENGCNEGLYRPYVV